MTSVMRRSLGAIPLLFAYSGDVNGGFQRDVDSRSDQFIPDASCTLQNPLPRSALIRAIGNVHSLGMEHC
jgi:hypothetical protein